MRRNRLCYRSEKPETYYVYGLVRDGSIVYVGLTKNPITRRLGHVRRFGRGARMIIIRALDGWGYTFASYEEERWIVHLRERGHPLVNVEPRSLDRCATDMLIERGVA